MSGHIPAPSPLPSPSLFLTTRLHQELVGGLEHQLHCVRSTVGKNSRCQALAAGIQCPAKLLIGLLGGLPLVPASSNEIGHTLTPLLGLADRFQARHVVRKLNSGRANGRAQRVHCPRRPIRFLWGKKKWSGEGRERAAAWHLRIAGACVPFALPHSVHIRAELLQAGVPVAVATQIGQQQAGHELVL